MCDAAWRLNNLQSVPSKIWVLGIIVLWILIAIFGSPFNRTQLSIVFVAPDERIVESYVNVDACPLNPESHSACNSSEPAALSVCHCSLINHCWFQCWEPTLVPSPRIEVSIFNIDILSAKIYKSKLKTSWSVSNIPCSLKQFL